jgi:hypothetical protein
MVQEQWSDEVSPGGLRQDHLVERQIRHRTPQALVLRLKLLEPLELIPVHAATLLAPAVIRRLRHADLTHRIGDRHPLSLQHFDLPKLQHDIFGFVSFSCHLWSS